MSTPAAPRRAARAEARDRGARERRAVGVARPKPSAAAVDGRDAAIGAAAARDERERARARGASGAATARAAARAPARRRARRAAARRRRCSASATACTRLPFRAPEPSAGENSANVYDAPEKIIHAADSAAARFATTAGRRRL